MSIQEIDFSKTLTDDQVYETIMSHYSTLSKDWISHQWNWMNNVYASFNDHYKYMIVISLIEKTLQFYDQMQIQYSYDEYYACLLYTSPSPRDRQKSRMPSSA